MINVDDFIEQFFVEHGEDNILEHAEIKRRYDPVKARAYYLRTRKLKGRKAAPKRIQEDEVPMKSPTGAKLVDFQGTKDGFPQGRATYSDGSVFDGNGWQKADPGAAKTKANPMAAARAKAVQQSLNNMRRSVTQMANGPDKQAALKRIGDAQRKLNVAKRRGNNAS